METIARARDGFREPNDPEWKSGHMNDPFFQDVRGTILFTEDTENLI